MTNLLLRSYRVIERKIRCHIRQMLFTRSILTWSKLNLVLLMSRNYSLVKLQHQTMGTPLTILFFSLYFAVSDRLSTGITVADIDFSAIDAVRTKMPISQVRRNICLLLFGNVVNISIITLPKTRQIDHIVNFQIYTLHLCICHFWIACKIFPFSIGSASISGNPQHAYEWEYAAFGQTFNCSRFGSIAYISIHLLKQSLNECFIFDMFLYCNRIGSVNKIIWVWLNGESKSIYSSTLSISN